MDLEQALKEILDEAFEYAEKNTSNTYEEIKYEFLDEYYDSFLELYNITKKFAKLHKKDISDIKISMGEENNVCLETSAEYVKSDKSYNIDLKNSFYTYLIWRKSLKTLFAERGFKIKQFDKKYIGKTIPLTSNIFELYLDEKYLDILDMIIIEV